MQTSSKHVDPEGTIPLKGCSWEEGQTLETVLRLLTLKFQMSDDNRFPLNVFVVWKKLPLPKLSCMFLKLLQLQTFYFLEAEFELKSLPFRLLFFENLGIM